MTNPITNADQAIEAAAKVAEDAITFGNQRNGRRLVEAIRSLKDQVASPSDGAGVSADPWEEKCKVANKIGAFTKVRELADSPYADDDRIKVPIRFGDIRAIDRALCALRPQPDLRAMLEKAEAALSGMIRLSDMGFDDSMKEPEENGNFAAHSRAVETRELLRNALADEIDRALGEKHD